METVDVTSTFATLQGLTGSTSTKVTGSWCAGAACEDAPSNGLAGGCGWRSGSGSTVNGLGQGPGYG